MSLLNRKRTLLAKLESVYGTDPTPTGMANAILCGNLNVTPLDAETVDRNNIKPYMGIAERLIASSSVKLDFEVELMGSGAKGLAPAWASLLKACGYAETVNNATVTITRVSTTATVAQTAHGRTIGDKVKISGAVETEYNGIVTVLATPTADTWTYTVSGSPATPATGTILAGVSVVYAPISSSFPSMTFYFNLDGVLHKTTGARGSCAFEVNVKNIPVMKFSFTGLYKPVTDVSAPSVDFSGFQDPLIANTLNTPAFSLFGYQGFAESMSLDLANQVEYRTLIGSESVNIIDRKPAGQFVIEATTVAEKDFWALVLAGTTGAMSLTHGLLGGYKVKLDAPNVSLQNPAYSDSQGVAMLSIPFTAAPDTGDDELTITCL